MKPPATIVIGEVVALRDTLNWFENCRFSDSASWLRGPRQSDALAETGSIWARRDSICPVIEIADPAPTRAARPSAIESRSYDWLIFTSANGVRFFLDRLDRSAADLRALRAASAPSARPRARPSRRCI
jgi:uroporphyrinogen III methyltransferase / synthase